MQARPSEPVYSTAVTAGRLLFSFWRLRRSETGLENIPATGGAVFAMTHFGYLEFALVEWVTWLRTRRHIRFLAKQSVFEKPVVGRLMRSMKHIPVDMSAGAGAFQRAVDALGAGEAIGVFPEAGVSASFTVREFKTGAVRLAAEAGVPIIPVAVWGGHRLLTKNRRIGFRERFRMPVSFAFGEPLLIGPDDDVQERTAELRATVIRLVEELQSEYPDAGGGQWWQPRHLGGSAPTPEEAAAADAARNARRAEAAERKAAQQATGGGGRGLPARGRRARGRRARGRLARGRWRTKGR